MLLIVDKPTLQYTIGEILIVTGCSKKILATHEAIYAYNFEGRRYYVGDKLGFLEPTVDFALKIPKIRDGVIEFLRSKDLNENEDLQEVVVNVDYIYKIKMKFFRGGAK